MATVHDRYQVVCSWCHHVTYEQTKAQAFDIAKRHHTKHTGSAQVSVFDVMARYGAPDLWAATGEVLSRRTERA